MSIELPPMPESDGIIEIDEGPYVGEGSELPHMAGARVESVGPAWSEALVRSYAIAAVMADRERSKAWAEMLMPRYEELRQLCLRWANWPESSKAPCQEALSGPGPKPDAYRFAALLDDFAILAKYLQEPA